MTQPDAASPGPTGTAGEPSEGLAVTLEQYADVIEEWDDAARQFRQAASIVRAAAAGGTAGEPSGVQWLLQRLLDELPARRDWLDPELEAALRAAAAGAAPATQEIVDDFVSAACAPRGAALAGGPTWKCPECGGFSFEGHLKRCSHAAPASPAVREAAAIERLRAALGAIRDAYFTPLHSQVMYEIAGRALADEPSGASPAVREAAAICRLDKDGAVDDVVISGDLFRMERMSQGHWWLAVYRGEQRVAFALTSNRRIEATVSEDEFGLSADTRAALAAEGEPAKGTP